MRCELRKKALNISLYISSFVPLYFLVIIKTMIEIINGNMTFNFTNSLLLISMSVLIIVGVVAVTLVIRNSGGDKQITVIDFKNTTDQHFLGYFSLFVLFALTFDLSKVSMTVVYVIILVLIGVVYVKNHLYNINPFLNIIGYSCYDVTYKDINGNEYTAQLYYKGKLNLAKYSVSLHNDGICFVVNQIVNKK